MPERGESVRLDGYLFRIEAVRRTRILNIRIEKQTKADEEGQD